MYFLVRLRPPRLKRVDAFCPYSTLFRSLRYLDDSAIRQELGEITPHRARVGRIGGAEVDEQHADARRRDGRMIGRQAHSGCADSGMRRMRRPVAANIALAVAGAQTGPPISPSPPGPRPLSANPPNVSGKLGTAQCGERG